MSEAIEALIAKRMAEAYLRDPAKIAKLCDEEIDRSGNLLGWLREQAGFGRARHLADLSAKSDCG